MVLNIISAIILYAVMIPTRTISSPDFYFIGGNEHSNLRAPGFSSISRIRRKLTTYTGFRPEFVASTSVMSSIYNPSVAVLSDESFVVTWAGDAGGRDVFTQIFNKDGSAVGSEFKENESSVDTSRAPSIVPIQNDDFILVWSSWGTNMNDIYAVKYDKSGTALASKVEVNQNTFSQQLLPVVIRLNSGKIIVIYSSAQEEMNSSYGIVAQEIDNDLNIVGSVFIVNTYTASTQYYPAACALYGGGFVAVWESLGQIIGSAYDVYAQIYDDSLNRVGSEFLVNTNTNEDQEYSSVVCLSDGGFVITWMTKHGNTVDSEIAAQKFDSNGNKVGSEFKVNEEINLQQKDPNAVLLSNGNFVISWAGYTGSAYFTKFKIYDNDLNVVTPQTTVNNGSAGGERGVSAAAFGNAEYVLCYNNGNTNDIRCRINEPCADANCIDCFNNSNYCDACAVDYDAVSGSCILCDSSCDTCYGTLENQCVTCPNAVSPYFGYCQCPSPSIAISKNPLFCGTCDIANCYECMCSNCSYSVVDGTNPIECKICDQGYFLQGGICIKCGDYCSVCSDLNQCVVCEGIFEESGGYCYCPEQYYFKDGQCLSCDFLCNRCNEDECFGCKATLVFEDGRCVCPHNYSLAGDSCYYNPLDYSISLESYFILLAFNDNLREHLSLSDIKQSYFLPDREELKLVIDPISLSVYVLRIEEESVPPNTTGIHVEFEELSGTSGISLEESRASVDLKTEEVEDYMKEDFSDVVTASSKTITEGTSLSGAASALGISFISGNPSSVWIFLNFIAMIYYMPLQNVGMPVKMKDHFQSFSFDFTEFIPSVSKISNTTSDTSPSNMWVEYGITSTDFITNNREFLILLGAGILLFIFIGSIFMLLKEGKYKEKVQGLFKHLKWNYFLRVWTQYYMKIVLGCLLSLDTMANSRYSIVEWLSVLMYLFCGVSIVIAMIGTYRNRFAIEEGKLEDYASFYEEFNCNKGWLSMLFYPLFYLRRYLYITGLYCLQGYPLIQVIMNSFLSLIVVFFLIYYRPFKDNSLNYLNILLESIITSMFIVSGFFLLDLQEENQDDISMILFIFSTGALSLFFILILIKIFFVLKDFKGKDSKVSEDTNNRARQRREERENSKEATSTTMLGLSHREISTIENPAMEDQDHRRINSSIN